MGSTVPTVFVVDDDPDMRASLAELLSAAEVPVQSFGSAAEFLNSYNEATPGCALLDIRMPEMSGLELQEKLRERGCGIPVIMMTAYGDVPGAVRALRQGAMDFIEKPFSGRVLLDRVKEAIEWDVEARKAKAENAEAASRFTSLTPREREVLRLLVDGRSLKEAAGALNRSIKTVEAHITRIRKKLGVGNRVELVRLALKAGLVRP